MSNGQRWLALDADLMGKPFTLDVFHQFGWAGVGTWVAFLCACKRSRVPGRISFISEADARAQLGILGDLVDNDGKEWTLADFWLFTGRKKQTRRTHRGRETNVISTHWGHWQLDASRSREAERKRTSREQTPRTPRGKASGQGRTKFRLTETETETTPQPPAERGADALRAGELQDLRAGVEAVRANMVPPVPPKKKTL